MQGRTTTPSGLAREPNPGWAHSNPSRYRAGIKPCPLLSITLGATADKRRHLMKAPNSDRSGCRSLRNVTRLARV